MRGWTLGAAVAMGLGAALLAPAVVPYWTARLTAGQSERRTSARALRPAAPAELDGVQDPEPAETERGAASSRPALSGDSLGPRPPALAPPTPTEAREPDDGEPEDEEQGELDVQSARAAAEAALVPPSLRGLPPTHPPLDLEARAPEPEGPAEPPPEEAAAEPPEPAEEPAPPRRVSLTVLEARTQPGLCRGSSAAADARDALVGRFHAFAWDGTSRLYLDPRLPPGAQEDLVADLEQAEREIARVLQLTPPRPDVFAYFDTRLLLAAGCTNENVVAYYDGALHVVPSHDDVAQSIMHEYTHHALTAAGVLGPAWAHEGIAMHMAGETWWRSGWMARVRDRPFSLEVMESAVPYTLRSDHAGLFYAQSAAMVACAIKGDPAGLRGLVDSLAAGEDQGDLSYQLPAAAAPLAWRACFDDLAR